MTPELEASGQRTAEGGETAPARVSSSRDVMLGERFKIRPGQTVMDLATPAAEAFVAVDQTQPDTACAALIARPEQLPRASACAQIKGLGHVGAAKLLEHGPVEWPDGTRRYAMIYETPAGAALLRRNASMQPLDPRMLVRNFIAPVTHVLAEYVRRGVAHRAIRPDNVFWYDFGQSKLIVGPCTAGPPGARQPAQFEPLELAICDPYGRGPGTAADDVYSLGATALALAMGRWPMADSDDAAVIERRIEVGNWDALAGKYNPPVDLYDFFRGTLADDPAERWTLPTLTKWLDGGRPILPRFASIAKSREPFLFEGKLYRTGRDIALAFARNPPQATAAIRTGVLADWARRALPDDLAAKKVQAMSAAESSAGRDGDPALVARICMALDPSGPIHISGISVRPDGVAPALARAYTSARDTLPAYDSLFRAGIHLEWVATQQGSQAAAGRSTRKLSAYERLSRWAMEPVPGSGLERCLYELDQRLPCLSPLCIDQWVETPGELLPAIDSAIADGDQKGFDRHIAAFMAARGAADETALKGLMGGAADEEARMASLRLLAHLQETYLVGSLPNLAAQCAVLVRPTLEQFQRISTKELIAHKSEVAIGQGDLKDLLNIVDDRVALEADKKGFESAKTEYAAANERLGKADLIMLDRGRQATYRGRETATLAAGSLALATFFGVLAAYLP
jgi:hypothetical protein